MKKFRLLALALLVLMLSLALLSCGECKHTDGNNDSICDECGKSLGDDSPDTPSDGFSLIEGGEIKFQIVKGQDVDVETVKAIDNFIKLAKKLGFEVKLVDDKKASEAETEVLIGTVSSRGEEYKYDKYSLGAEGYAIKPLGTKVIVTAGSPEMLKETVEKFFSKTLGITEGGEIPESLVLSESDSEIKVQDNYRVSDVTVDGESVKGYTIVVDAAVNKKFSPLLNDAAKQLQDFLYTKAGIRLEIADADDFGGEGGAIFLCGVSKGKAGSKGFRARLDGKNLIIECAHYNKFEEAFASYYNKTFVTLRDDILTLKTFESGIDITKVSYSDFGAVGDGKADDAEAFKKAHDFANDGGQTVVGAVGKTYRLNNVPSQIIIKTDVDWKGAKIIFDDSNVLREKSGVTEVTGVEAISDNGLFLIEQDVENITISAGSDKITAINAARGEDGLVLRGLESRGNATENIGFALGYPAMLTVYNDNNRNYLRYGYQDQDDAAWKEQQELIIVDKDGKIDKSTPLLHDYTEVTRIIVHRIDTAPITVENATIESIASRVNLLGGYRSMNRGITIKRANVTIKDIEHIITGEFAKNQPVKQDEKGLSVEAFGFTYKNGQIYDPDGNVYNGNDVKPFIGHSYGGFICAERTHNTLVENVIFQARVLYIEGTYDISAERSNKTVFKNCRQSNFFEEDTIIPNLSKCWGVAGTNYCKNLEYIDSELTRYDAHSGVTNGKITGGMIAMLRLIGGGEFTIDGTTVYIRGGSAPFQLREDYGASFNGTVKIKNTSIVVVDAWNHGKREIPGIFSAPASYWDMGYKTFCPSIEIDGLKIDTSLKEIPLFARESYTSYSQGKHYPRLDIFSVNPDDPTRENCLFHYETKDPEAWIAKNIEAEGSRFEGCSYEVKREGSSSTVIVTDKANNYPYKAPALISIKNSESKDYQIILWESDFFKNTKIDATAGNLQIVPLPKN